MKGQKNELMYKITLFIGPQFFMSVDFTFLRLQIFRMSVDAQLNAIPNFQEIGSENLSWEKNFG
jgi:hypothetical protein